MKHRILFVERKPSEYVSIERVFRRVADALPHETVTVDFQQLPYGNGIFGIIGNLLAFRKRSADIYHVTGHAHYICLVLPRERTVLTIHDLAFLHTRTGIRRYILKKILLDLPLKRVRYVTAISAATRDEILRSGTVAAEKIRVIENPLTGAFATDGEKPFDAECPTILQVGTMDQKNIPRLAEALNGIKCRLRIIGHLSPEQVAVLSENGIDYENASDLDDQQMRNEYENADMVAFCSTYEGFGLPIIEAQAMCKPVITSDLPPMNDVGGPGVALVDPYDTASIRSGIRRLIEDDEYRNALISRGAENVKRFDAAKIAGQYAELYEEIVRSV